MHGLHAVVTHNVFRFGDTYWLQMAGTAMGGSPAPMYATLYFGILEQQILPRFPSCRFYRRYIDDGFLVWIPDPNWSLDVGLLKWQSFQAAFASVSPLEWKFSPLLLMVAFLDVMVKITDDGQITTQVYEKPQNLYLYLPPHSCHAPGITKSLVFGMILRYFRISSDRNAAWKNVRKFLERLVERGHSPRYLSRMLRIAVTRGLHLGRQYKSTRQNKSLGEKPLRLHLTYHPNDPAPADIYRLFESTVQYALDSSPLCDIENKQGAKFGESRLTVVYSRSPNLGNLLSPRKLESPGIQPSTILDGSGVE